MCLGSDAWRRATNEVGRRARSAKATTGFKDYISRLQYVSKCLLTVIHMESTKEEDIAVMDIEDAAVQYRYLSVAVEATLLLSQFSEPRR